MTDTITKIIYLENYTQIEKELLAIINGILECHQYGWKIKVKTNYRPLITISRYQQQEYY